MPKKLKAAGFMLRQLGWLGRTASEYTQTAISKADVAAIFLSRKVLLDSRGAAQILMEILSISVANTLLGLFWKCESDCYTSWGYSICSTSVDPEGICRSQAHSVIRKSGIKMKAEKDVFLADRYVCRHSLLKDVLNSCEQLQEQYGCQAMVKHKRMISLRHPPQL